LAFGQKGSKYFCNLMNHDEQFMRRAIGLAARGCGNVSPNPMVGAVLVHQGRIIGEGWHAQYGDVHAEVACLAQVMDADKKLIPESTMYVTLEPCAHQGRQPPCARRLVAEGIQRVVIAVEDPFPQVSGKGIAILRDAGIEVETGVCREEARWMCRRFLQVQEGGRPYVILKWAQSADGYLAPADGSRYQLSNQFSQTLVHKWRTEESAILVGYNTALADDPQLTARAWNGPQPLRVALDRNLWLPLSHFLLDETTPTWIVNEHEERDGITRRLRLPFDDQLLPALLRRLADAGKNSLFVEGGAKLLASFVAAGLWDEARVFATPVQLGEGISAPSLKAGKPVLSTVVGDDMLHIFQPGDSRCTYIPGQIL
jgi:diaminohydroxyphosphoribosylaminopyrimidine deaminase/5-amino-6-(5-phosphoribosylamino)uracil reductase